MEPGDFISSIYLDVSLVLVNHDCILTSHVALTPDVPTFHLMQTVHLSDMRSLYPKLLR